MKKVAIITAAAALSACATSNPAQNTAQNTDVVGAVNPASEFCVQQGGKLQIQKDAQGNEYGVCHLPNGKVVDEWEFFRQHSAK
ncbi:hypothetical protein B0181_05840 [Moraxella caviae]|uniref:Hemolysin n=1 Tax=Moraxella caviae TaxID=34060 RepID=A0A1T0A308_9GAMM|nr:DUF333 domain-containing protein [Moraxella caviae]OOR89929.1 hypothetical protein B0181_05840 [Moraxella caviae]STZ14314.1 Putative hemolysin [Moraxella caviae]